MDYNYILQEFGYFIITCLIGSIIYFFVLFTAKTTEKKREIFPFFLIIPASFIMLPVVLFFYVLSVILYFLGDFLPSILFKEKDYE